MLGNWIRQTTTTTGTGNLTISTVTGYAAFSDYFANSERFKYAILDDSTGAPIEAGIGYLSSGALVREVIETTMVSGVLDRSNPSAVTLGAGTKRVICTSTVGSSFAKPPGVWTATNKGYGSLVTATSVSTISLTIDRAYAFPFEAAIDAEIDAILFRQTTAAAAGKLARAAIFSIGADGLPGVKLAESGTIAADGANGVKTCTFTRFRPPARFFACLLTDGALGVQSMGTALANHALGYDSVLVAYGYLYHVGATGLTFPSPWTPVGVTSGTACPQLVCRVP